MASFVLDSSVFIQSAKGYYAFDLAPGFWVNLHNLVQQGQIYSIDKVRDELAEYDDTTFRWFQNNFATATVTTDSERIISTYKEVMGWVQASEQYFDYAKAEFARGADGWLIAAAKANSSTVVTLEKYNADIKKGVPIPNVCQALGVPTIDTFELLRHFNIRLS